MKPQTLLKSLGAVLGSDRVACDESNRLFYSRDMMSGNILDQKAGIAPRKPDVICWPESAAEISKILRIANRNRTPVIPFGGGSGVSGGTIPVSGGIILDLKRMNRIGEVEEEDGRYFVTAQTGIVGQHLEDHLQTKGFTLGHFPSSIFCATLGGYLAARSAGQLSSKYGKIEDMTQEIEVVLPSGQIIPLGRRPIRAFPSLRPTDLFLGTEGCLGVITQARLEIHPLPPITRYRGVSFNRLADGLKSIREIMQTGLRPSVIRLYDPLDTMILKHGYNSAPGPLLSLLNSLIGKIPLPFKTLREGLQRNALQWILENPYWVQKFVERLPTEVLLILGFEGEPDYAEAQEKAALGICRRAISKDLGEKPGLHWLEHRYSISFKMPQIFDQDSFVDTIEVATTWNRLEGLYERIREVLIPNTLLLAHFSHAYPEGCSIYFTFLGRTGDPAKDRRLYNKVWNEAMEACLKAGGTISHHHGIGLLKARFLPRELGGLMEFYRQIKRTLDPRNIMNPGKMGLS